MRGQSYQGHAKMFRTIALMLIQLAHPVVLLGTAPQLEALFHFLQLALVGPLWPSASLGSDEIPREALPKSRGHRWSWKPMSAITLGL